MPSETFGRNTLCGPWTWSKDTAWRYWLVFHDQADGQGQFLADPYGLSFAVVDDFGNLVRVRP